MSVLEGQYRVALQPKQWLIRHCSCGRFAIGARLAAESAGTPLMIQGLMAATSVAARWTPFNGTQEMTTTSAMKLITTSAARATCPYSQRLRSSVQTGAWAP